jgi:membrane protease YdiL (CAAX protease family)
VSDWLARNGFPGWLAAFLWLVAAFIGFQLLAAVVAIGILMADGSFADVVADLGNLTKYPGALFAGNSTGQILVMGLGSWWVARLATSKESRLAFLRLAPVPGFGKTALYAVLLTIAVQPLIQFLGWVNLQLPLPQAWIDLDKSQMAMIEQLLKGDMWLVILLFHVAVVPGICEEVMFRGFILRAFERDMAPWLAIALTGTLFGLYHLRMTQALPLILLGILITWLVWRTGSLQVVILVHFLNNGIGVLAARYFPEVVFDPAFSETLPPVWMLALSAIAVPVIILYLNRHLHESAPRPQPA